MIKIGITGGIGSGKSTAANYLSALGYRVIDADKLAFDLAIPGSEILFELQAEFGPSIINEDGSLNRRLLGRMVFKDKEARKKLDAIFQPKILDVINNCFDAYENDSKALKKNVAFLNAALIFESGIDKTLDEVWLIDAELDIKIKRIQSRDSLSYDDIFARMNSQLGSKTKKKLANKIIFNNGEIKDLESQLDKLLKEF